MWKFERNCNFNKLLLTCNYNKLFLQLETIDIVSKANTWDDNNIIIREEKVCSKQAWEDPNRGLNLQGSFISCKELATIDKKFNLQLAALKLQVKKDIVGH